MKILKFINNKSSINMVDSLFIRHMAFAGIDIFEEQKYANICFECVDSQNFLINLSIPVNIDNDADFVSLYSNVPLTGLLHTGAGVGILTVVDLFRKEKTSYEGKEYYSAICVDTISSSRNNNSLDKADYFKVLFSRDQFYYIASYISDIASNKNIDYYSGDPFLLLTPKSTDISINTENFNYEILGVNYPKKSGLLFKNDNLELQILIKINDKYCVLWHLSYNKNDMAEILKNKKFKPICMDDVYDLQVYSSINFILADYAKSADNPLQKVVILSKNIGTAIDEFDVYTTISIHKQLYINWIEQIYKELIK